MTARKGTKGDPFKVGDRVRTRVRWWKHRDRGTIVSVTSPEQNSPAMGERSYAPIRYRVRFDGTGEELDLRCYDLEELPPTDAAAPNEQ